MLGSSYSTISHRIQLIESGIIAVTIPNLPTDNFWLNSVQKKNLFETLMRYVALNYK